MVTGGLGTSQFAQYIADNAKALETMMAEINSPYDIDESTNKYLNTINSVAMKTILKEKFDESKINENITVPKRPNMASKIANKNLYEEFDSLNDDLKSILTDEPWSEIYKDTILEDYEYTEDDVL